VNQGKVMQFSLNAKNLKIREILHNRDFIKIELWAISDQYPNNNNSHFPLPSMQKNINEGEFYNKPVLGYFNPLMGDFEEHNCDCKYDSELKLEYFDYRNGEIPMGFIRENDNVRIEKKDGHSWIVFTAILWVKYNYQQIKKLLKDKQKKVSVEITVIKSHKDDNDVEIFDDWKFDGVTILGRNPYTNQLIKEGISGAHLTLLDKLDANFSADVKRLKFAYKELDENQNNNDIKEQERSLYKNNQEMEGMKLFTTEQKAILEKALREHFSIAEDNSLSLTSVEDNFIKFNTTGLNNSNSYSCSFKWDATNNTYVFDCDGNCDCDDPEKDDLEEGEKKETEACDDSKSEKECDNSEKECDNSKKECDNSEKECDNSEKECNNFEEEKCSKEEEKSEEECKFEEKEKESKSEEECKFEGDSDKDPEKDEDEPEIEMCNFVEIEGKQYDVKALFAKYQEDIENSAKQFTQMEENYKAQLQTSQENFAQLEQKYNDCVAERDQLSATVKANENHVFAEKMKGIALEHGLSEDAVNKIFTNCENGQYENEEACTKDIAYEKFLMEEKNKVVKSKGFSCPVSDSKKEIKKEETGTVDAFSKLKNYINQ